MTQRFAAESTCSTARSRTPYFPIARSRRGDCCSARPNEKLEATRYHKDNLVRIVQSVSSVVPESVARNAKQALVQDFTSGIEKEFEAFLMQGKASLDILVKIFKPLFGVSLTTFGDAGGKVKNAVRRNLATTNPERTRRLENLIIQHEDWIGKWFTQERTTVSHYRALVHSGVIYGPEEGGGAKTLALPRTKDGFLIHEVAVSVYGKLWVSVRILSAMLFPSGFHRLLT